MNESLKKRPTVPEHIEIIKTEIRDGNDVVEFEFQFAKSISGDKMNGFWADDESAVKKIIDSKLHKKGWVSADGKTTLVPVSGIAEPSTDSMAWKLTYRRTNPNPSSSLQ